MLYEISYSYTLIFFHSVISYTLYPSISYTLYPSISYTYIINDFSMVIVIDLFNYHIANNYHIIRIGSSDMKLYH